MAGVVNDAHPPSSVRAGSSARKSSGLLIRRSGVQIPPGPYIQRFCLQQVEKHFIPMNEDLWSVDNYESFLEERVKLIAKAIERIWYQSAENRS